MPPLTPPASPVGQNEVPYGEAQSLDSQQSAAPLAKAPAAPAPVAPAAAPAPTTVASTAPVNEGAPTSYLPQWGTAVPGAGGRVLTAAESVAVAVLGMGQTTPTARRFALAMLGNPQDNTLEPFAPAYSFRELPAPGPIFNEGPPVPEDQTPPEVDPATGEPVAPEVVA